MSTVYKDHCINFYDPYRIFIEDVSEASQHRKNIIQEIIILLQNDTSSKKIIIDIDIFKDYDISELVKLFTKISSLPIECLVINRFRALDMCEHISLILEFISQIKTLTNISLNGIYINNTTNKIIKDIIIQNKLVRFEMSDILDYQSTRVINSLTYTNSLERIELINCGLNDSDGDTIMCIISNNQCLEYLDLSYNKFNNCLPNIGNVIAKSNIKNLVIDINTLNNDPNNIMINNLKENYTLTMVDVVDALSPSDFEFVFDDEIDYDLINDITKRNIDIANQIRFKKTKTLYIGANLK